MIRITTRRGLGRILATTFVVSLGLLPLGSKAFAGNATWSISANGDWDVAGSWSIATVPNGPTANPRAADHEENHGARGDRIFRDSTQFAADRPAVVD